MATEPNANVLYTKGAFKGVGPLSLPKGFKGVEAAQDRGDMVSKGTALSAQYLEKPDYAPFGTGFKAMTYAGNDPKGKALVAAKNKSIADNSKPAEQPAVGGAESTGEMFSQNQEGYPKVGSYTAPGNTQPYLGNPLIDPNKPGSVHYSGAQAPRYTREQLVANIDAMEQQGASQQEVQEYLDSLKQRGGNRPETFNPNPYGGAAMQQPSQPSQPAEKKDPGFIEDVGQTLSKSGNTIATAVKKGISGEYNPLSSAFQTVGGLAQGGVGLVGDVARHAPLIGPAVRGIENAVGSGVEALAKTQTGQDVISAGQEFAKNNPETAGNIGAAFDIATAVPTFRGLQVAKKYVSDPVSGAVRGAAGLSTKGPTGAIQDIISPKLSEKDLAEAVAKRGTENRGILKSTQVKADPRVVELAETVDRQVPGFRPGATMAENSNAVQGAITRLNTQLKADVKKYGEGRIYSHKELASTLNKIEPPLLIASDTAMNNAYNRVKAKALEIAQKKGGKVENLLEARQEFDGFIKQQFPNLYSSDTLTPMRQAVRDIRKGMTDFTAKNLPDNVKLRETLRNESNLIEVLENMAPKVVEELGTTAPSRFINSIPGAGLIKSVGDRLLSGASGLIRR